MNVRWNDVDVFGMQSEHIDECDECDDCSVHHDRPAQWFYDTLIGDFQNHSFQNHAFFQNNAFPLNVVGDSCIDYMEEHHDSIMNSIEYRRHISNERECIEYMKHYILEIVNEANESEEAKQ